MISKLLLLQQLTAASSTLLGTNVDYQNSTNVTSVVPCKCRPNKNINVPVTEKEHRHSTITMRKMRHGEDEF
jgi:hypothetical protein